MFVILANEVMFEAEMEGSLRRSDKYLAQCSYDSFPEVCAWVMISFIIFRDGSDERREAMSGA